MTPTILVRIANGDRGAVQECLDAYGGLVWSLARRLSPNPADAEDAVQEIFIDVWKSASRFDERQASEAAFIATIARRRLVDRHRASRRAVRTEDLAEFADSPLTGQAARMESFPEAETARRALEELRPEQRNVLVQSLVEGLTYEEISERSGTPLGTVKTHARRGLIAIRERLTGSRASAKESGR